MASIKEVLLATRNRFHDLLSATMTQLATKAVTEDDMHRVSSSLSHAWVHCSSVVHHAHCTHFLL